MKSHTFLKLKHTQSWIEAGEYVKRQCLLLLLQSLWVWQDLSQASLFLSKGFKVPDTHRHQRITWDNGSSSCDMSMKINDVNSCGCIQKERNFIKKNVRKMGNWGKVRGSPKSCWLCFIEQWRMPNFGVLSRKDTLESSSVMASLLERLWNGRAKLRRIKLPPALGSIEVYDFDGFCWVTSIS